MAKSVGIILAGGIGLRFGGGKPKQYHLLDGKEIIWYSINAFREAKKIDDFIVVVGDSEYVSGAITERYNVKTVCGGNTRNRSFYNALCYIRENYPDCEKVVENNAACPFITPKQIDDFIDLLDDNDFVQTTFHITDALGSYSDRLVNRDDYFLIQAPDAYRFDMLMEYFDPDSPNGHPATHLPCSAKGYNYFESGHPFKVTYPEDIEFAEILLRRMRAK